jgi:hypothetical protein
MNQSDGTAKESVFAKVESGSAGDFVEWARELYERVYWARRGLVLLSRVIVRKCWCCGKLDRVLWFYLKGHTVCKRMQSEEPPF